MHSKGGFMKIKIRDIEIVFSSNQQSYLKDIKIIIENNYEIVSSCLNEDKIIDISSDVSIFNEIFYNIVIDVYANDVNKNAFSDKDFLPSLYIETLIRKKGFFDTKIVEMNENISDELLDSLIAYKYFEVNGSFDDYVEYLKYRNNRDKIFQWLQTVARWDTYNYLLGITSNCLKTDNEDFFKQMNCIIDIWLSRAVKHVKDKNYSNKQYPKISDKKFDELFYDFLNYINAPDEWINIYNKLKRDGLIIVENDNENNSMCFKDKDGIWKILICNADNLRGFCTFIHEFIHYVSRQTDLSVEKISIAELPSLFFENVSVDFLNKKGYSDKITHQIANDREIYNYSLCISMLPLISDLIRYINQGEIRKNDKMTLYQKQIDTINQTKKEMLKILTDTGQVISNSSVFKEINVDIEKDVDDDCDLLIDSFIKDGLLVIDGYQYLLDSYLSEKILGMDDSTTIQKMIDVTNNLGMMSVEKILKLFGIENALQNDVKKLKK